MTLLSTVNDELRTMGSPYVVGNGGDLPATVCPVCLTVFPPFPLGLLCPNCSWWRAVRRRRSRLLLPVQFVGWPRDRPGLSIESAE